MMVEKVASDLDAEIRTSHADWMPLLGAGGIVFAAEVVYAATGSRWSIWHLVFSGVLVAEALWIRTFGVDLTEDFAIVRGIRRHRIPWRQVQAVIPFDQLGSRRVSLTLDSGRSVNLRAPMASLGFGAARYEQDFHRIGQWWLAHRGESWLPTRPEAPQLPVQGSEGSTMTGT